MDYISGIIHISSYYANCSQIPGPSVDWATTLRNPLSAWSECQNHYCQLLTEIVRFVTFYYQKFVGKV